VWQRNCYERIIRSDRELDAVRQYIEDNPAAWNTGTEKAERAT
jgi:putative transposase